MFSSKKEHLAKWKKNDQKVHHNTNPDTIGKFKINKHVRKSECGSAQHRVRSLNIQLHDGKHKDTSKEDHVCTVIQLYIITVATLFFCRDFSTFLYHVSKSKSQVTSDISKQVSSVPKHEALLSGIPKKPCGRILD